MPSRRTHAPEAEKSAHLRVFRCPRWSRVHWDSVEIDHGGPATATSHQPASPCRSDRSTAYSCPFSHPGVHRCFFWTIGAHQSGAPRNVAGTSLASNNFREVPRPALETGTPPNLPRRAFRHSGHSFAAQPFGSALASRRLRGGSQRNGACSPGAPLERDALGPAGPGLGGGRRCLHSMCGV
jgi:hypothetical protein